jgi:hypothetical protein
MPIFKPKPKPAPTAPGGHTLSEAEKHGHTLTEAEHNALKANWRCSHDGQLNSGVRCTTCGAGKHV